MISAACSAARSDSGLHNGRNKSFFFSSYEVPQQELRGARGDDHSDRGDVQRRLLELAGRQRQPDPLYDPATTRVNPNGPGFVRDPFPNNQIPLSRFSQISRNVIALATMRPDLSGRAQQLHLHAGRRDQDQSLEQVQHQARSQPVEQGSDRILFHWGEVLVIPPRTARRRAARALNNFRDEDSNTRVPATWDRVISPTLVNRVSFGHNDWFQARVSFNSDKGWGTKIGLKNVPGPTSSSH